MRRAALALVLSCCPVSSFHVGVPCIRHQSIRASPVIASTVQQQSNSSSQVWSNDVESNAGASWIETNLLQGVRTGPSTYAIMTVYFVQGVLGLASLARTYFMKDELGLGAAEASALLGITAFPWVIKPIYGFLTDGLPIMGYRRKPYLIIAGILGSASWASLATVVETPTQAVVASTVASLGVAVSDVVVDSLVVERARR